MEIALYGRTLRRRWRIIVAVTLLGIAGATVFSLSRDPVYSANAEVYVSAAVADNVNDLSQGGDFAEQAVIGYAELATSPYVLAPVIETLDLESTAVELADMISVETPEGTSVLRVVVESESPALAAEITNAVISRLTSAVEEVTPIGPSADAYVQLTAIAPAVVPTSPSSRSYLTNVVIGGALGLALGLLIGLGRELSDNTVRSLRQLEESGQKVLVIITRSSTGSIPSDAEREQYRILGVKVTHPGEAGAIVVTSPTQSTTTSSVAMNLASSLVETGARVLLVDARLPSLSTPTFVSGPSTDEGFHDVLEGSATIGSVVSTSPETGVDFLSAGSARSASVVSFSASAIVHFIATARTTYDWVVFDAPAVLPSADALVLCGSASGTVLVTDLGRTKLRDATEAREALGEVGAVLYGLVVTGE